MAEVSYQAMAVDGTVSSGTIQVDDLVDLAQADQIAREAAGENVSVDVTAARTNEGRELVSEWEDAWADGM